MDGCGEDISLRYWAVLLFSRSTDPIRLLSSPTQGDRPLGRQHLQHSTAASTLMLTKGSQCVEFSLHCPSIYSSQPSRPSIPLSPPSLAPHKAPHGSPWLPMVDLHPAHTPLPNCPHGVGSDTGAEGDGDGDGLFLIVCPVPSVLVLLLALCEGKPVAAAHRRPPSQPPTTATVPLTACPTDSDARPRRPSAPSQILHRPPAAGLARWLLAHRYPTIRRRRRRPCSVKVWVVLLSEILPHLRHHSPAAG